MTVCRRPQTQPTNHTGVDHASPAVLTVTSHSSDLPEGREPPPHPRRAGSGSRGQAVPGQHTPPRQTCQRRDASHPITSSLAAARSHFHSTSRLLLCFVRVLFSPLNLKSGCRLAGGPLENRGQWLKTQQSAQKAHGLPSVVCWEECRLERESWWRAAGKRADAERAPHGKGWGCNVTAVLASTAPFICSRKGPEGALRPGAREGPPPTCVRNAAHVSHVKDVAGRP